MNIKERINKRNKDLEKKLETNLFLLDCKLTGKATKLNSLNIEEFVLNHGEYYLSDGGYSRIIFDGDNMNLRYTSNSLQKVKDRWGDCTELIKNIEYTCYDLLTLWEYEFDFLFGKKKAKGELI